MLKITMVEDAEKRAEILTFIGDFFEPEVFGSDIIIGGVEEMNIHMEDDIYIITLTNDEAVAEFSMHQSEFHQILLA